MLVNGKTIPARTPAGALIARFDSPGYETCRTEDGDAWTCTPYGALGGAYYPFPFVYAAARPGGPIPAARLLANGQGGPAYSDDDGRSWSPSDLMADYGPYGHGLAVIDGGPLHGTAVAVVQRPGDFRFHAFQSRDGATWTDVGPVPQLTPGEEGGDTALRLTALPGGLIAAYGGTAELYLSGDGGRSWQSVFDADGETMSFAYVADAALGPDGRLYIGVNSPRTFYEEELGGVYRTAAVAFAVASEAPPEAPPSEAGGARLVVRPNPSRGVVSVRLVAEAPASSASVQVYDALGRRVALLHDGPLAAETLLRVDTSGWPPGVYVVRATGGVRASARITVAR